MRVAIVCSKYSLEEKNAWLTNDLAYAYRELGHDVWVYCLDWARVDPTVSYIDTKGITVIYINQPNWQKFLGHKLGLVFKWLFSSWWATTQLKTPSLNFDLLIYFSPAVATAGIVHKLKKYAQKKIMILWDFFPIANAELGLMPKKAMPIAKFLEEKYINYADHIGLMSLKNIEFFDNYYNLKNKNLSVIPIWGSEFCVLNDKKIDKINRDKINLVFGGQLVEGRGLELLLDIARLAEKYTEIEFVVAGDGRRKQWFLEKIAEYKLKNINFLGMLTREEYMGILQISDIGLILNSGMATVPTFPSKSIDYFRSSLPLIVAIEPVSDMGIIIEQEIKAGYNCNVFEPEEVLEKILHLSRNKEARYQLGKNGYHYFINNMTVKSVANKILKDVDLGGDV